MDASANTPDTLARISNDDLQRICALISSFGASSCIGMKVSLGAMSIEMSKAAGPAIAAAAVIAPPAAPMPMPMPEPGTATEDHIIKAVAHGVFYMTPGEGAAPFVREGQTIAEGDRIGLLEAMKVFTEVLSDVPGTVIACLVENGSEVAPGTPLMRIRS